MDLFSQKTQTLYAVDAHGFLHRAYHALPRLTTSKGEEVGALYGFSRALLKIMRENSPDCLVVCFDSPGKNFRHEIFPEYKAGRPETEDALKTQLGLAREMTEGMGIKIAAMEGYEADDLLAAVAVKAAVAGLSVVLVTSDKDALQLAGERIKILRGDGELWGEKEVAEKYGLPPRLLTDYFALAGDSTDNVPGVRGIGPKMAAGLLLKYGSIENILQAAKSGDGGMPESAAKKILASADELATFRRLVALDTNSPLDFKPEDCRIKEPPPGKLLELFKRFEFRDILSLAGPASSAVVFDALPAVSDWDTVVNRAFDSKSLFIGADDTWLCAGLPDGTVSARKTADFSRGDFEKIKSLAAGDRLLIGHYLKETLHALRLDALPEIRKTKFFDVALAAYCLNPSRANYGFGELAAEYLDVFPARHDFSPDKMLFASKHIWKMKDALEKNMAEKGVAGLFYELEIPLISVLAGMEATGIGVDAGYLKAFSSKLEEKLDSLRLEINGLSGMEINLNSPKQIGALLFENLKLPVIRKTKTGYSTDEEVLKTLAPAHPIAAKILEYRESSKLLSSFVSNLISMSAKDGRLHTFYDQTGTATGRLSSSKPNLQNIPVRSALGRDVRRGFVPKEGFLFLSADYSQIDLRVLAHVSGDTALTEAFLKGGDVHLKTACEVFHLNPEGVDNEIRRRAKAINFGIVYGQTPSGLANELGISREEAQLYITHYFETYKGVREWIEKNLASARHTGYVSTFMGRIRLLPEINSANGSVRAFAERVAVNTPIQGGSADIIKKAMLDLAEALSTGSRGQGAEMLLQVHDELLFEVPETQLETAAGIIRYGMENAARLNVPLIVELKIGKNWQDMEHLVK